MPRQKATGADELVKVHITIPTWLNEEVKKSAHNTDRSFSKMVVHLLRQTYGDRR